jgi:hypothetical protein
MSRAVVVFASLLLLSGCGTAGAVLGGASLAILIHTDKTPADHAIGYVADMDCSILYAANKQPYCRDPKAEPNGHERLAALSARLYCYRTLGGGGVLLRPAGLHGERPDASRLRLSAGGPPGISSACGQAAGRDLLGTGVLAGRGREIEEHWAGNKTSIKGRRARPMAKLYRLDRLCRAPKATFFDRNELNQLLSLYSRRVANGEWRDYAIDQRGGSAVFSVFRHTHEAPIFRIAKRQAGVGRAGEFVVSSGPETLKQAETMTEALSIFQPALRVVS